MGGGGGTDKSIEAVTKLKWCTDRASEGESEGESVEESTAVAGSAWVLVTRPLFGDMFAKSSKDCRLSLLLASVQATKTDGLSRQMAHRGTKSGERDSRSAR